MFSFGGVLRSYSFHIFHVDVVVTSTSVDQCPAVDCEWVCFKNNPTSSGNITLGSERLDAVGNGIVLEPGDVTGWIPAQNVGLFWHKEADESTQLEYMVIGHTTPVVDLNAILQEGSFHYLLQEDGYILLKEV